MSRFNDAPNPGSIRAWPGSVEGCEPVFQNCIWNPRMKSSFSRRWVKRGM